MPAVMAKLFESMKEATGIDLADIVKADTYDAKVNRNVNVSGIDSVNLVVKEEKPAARNRNKREVLKLHKNQQFSSHFYPKSYIIVLMRVIWRKTYYE